MQYWYYRVFLLSSHSREKIKQPCVSRYRWACQRYWSESNRSVRSNPFVREWAEGQSERTGICMIFARNSFIVRRSSIQRTSNCDASERHCHYCAVEKRIDAQITSRRERQPTAHALLDCYCRHPRKNEALNQNNTMIHWLTNLVFIHVSDGW